LQQLGAVSIRHAVYVLPDSPQSREDFEWMKAEIHANKGEASVFAATTIDSLTNDDIVGVFRADREQLYTALREEVRKLARVVGRTPTAKGIERRRLHRTVRQLRDRFGQVVSSDFFAAPGREETEAALEQLELLVAPALAVPEPSAAGRAPLSAADYRRRTWMTRPRPGIDRCGSAWLIRRFIDPRARFVFGDASDVPDTIPFDTYDAEFSHHGGHCTFEVLCERFAVQDPAVVCLARVVHDLDLKESRFGMPEAPGIGRLIDGLRLVYAKDDELLEQGMTLFESLYRSYSSEPPPASRRVVRRRRAVTRKGP
jgi:hypothetical protein